MAVQEYTNVFESALSYYSLLSFPDKSGELPVLNQWNSAVA